MTSMYGLRAQAHFDAAHFLTDYYGKCENLHGHRWEVLVTVEQAELQTEGTMRGMVLDFGVLKKAVRQVAGELDHTFLVEEGSLDATTLDLLRGKGFAMKVLPFRTTAENLARWFFGRLEAEGLPVVEVEVDETPENRAFYRA